MAKHRNIIHVESQNPPIVELDSAAHAAYVRFSREKVARTEIIDVSHSLVTMDLTEDGKVVGVELTGISEFGVESLVKKSRNWSSSRDAASNPLRSSERGASGGLGCFGALQSLTGSLVL